MRVRLVSIRRGKLWNKMYGQRRSTRNLKNAETSTERMLRELRERGAIEQNEEIKPNEQSANQNHSFQNLKFVIIFIGIIFLIYLIVTIVIALWKEIIIATCIVILFSSIIIYFRNRHKKGLKISSPSWKLIETDIKIRQEEEKKLTDDFENIGNTKLNYPNL
jgi:hypothetical protein